MIDQDEYQEYQCLLLEGHSEAEARKLARAANDRINSRRLSGPLTGDTRHGHGSRPLISDMTNMDIYSEATSITLDARSDWERDIDHDRQISVDVDEVLSWMAPKQRAFLVHKYGIGVPAAENIEELAERVGMSVASAKSTLQKIRKKVADIQRTGGYEAWRAGVLNRRAAGADIGRQVRYS